VLSLPASRVKPTALTDGQPDVPVAGTPGRWGNRLVIDVLGLMAGMYLLHLESDKGRRVLKFVKE
jgi:hypothetical protein